MCVVMSDKLDCKVCREAQKRKHKYDKIWKIWAIISTILAIFFIILYFASGTVIETTEYENEIEIENVGTGTQTNNNIGSVNIQEEPTNWKYALFYTFIGLMATGGLFYGCYAVAKNDRKKQSKDYEQNDGSNSNK